MAKNPLVIVCCERCGDDFEVPNNVAGRARYCPPCRAIVHLETHHDSYHEQMKREESRKRKIASEFNIGGDYHICKDPDNTWGYDSSFTFNEILNLINRGYFSSGTEFRRVPSSKATHRVIRTKDGMRLISIANPNVIIGKVGRLEPIPISVE